MFALGFTSTVLIIFWVLLVCYCSCIPWMHFLEFLSSPPPPVPSVYESQELFCLLHLSSNYRIEFYENKKKRFFPWNFQSIAVLLYWFWFFKIFCWVCKFSNLNLIILWFLWILPCSLLFFFTVLNESSKSSGNATACWEMSICFLVLAKYSF